LVSFGRNSLSQSTDSAAAPSVNIASTMAVRLGHHIVLIPSPTAVNFERTLHTHRTSISVSVLILRMREVACQLVAAALCSSEGIIHAECVAQGMIRHYRVSALFRQYQAPRTVTPIYPPFHIFYHIFSSLGRWISPLCSIYLHQYYLCDLIGAFATL